MLENSFVINVYSILLLLILLYHSLKQAEKESIPSRLYILLLGVTALELIADVLGRFDGRPNTLYPILNHIGNFTVFFLNSVLPSLWLLYVYYQVYNENRNVRRLYLSLAAVNAANLAFVILSQFYGWIYYIDADNIYHRGPFFLLSAAMVFVLHIATYVLLVIKRRKIEKRYFFALAFFVVPPLACVVLQSFFYGISVIYNGVVLSLLLIFFNIQNQSIHIDYLTGVSNRKKLETHLREKVSLSHESRTFSAIMLDLDNFKSINDTFGHAAGDNVLEAAAKLLKNCIRSNDLVARFGGDEFCIVLDISDNAHLEAAVRRINDAIQKFNQSGALPYKLGFSMGYAVYDRHSDMTVEEYQKLIDMRMYEDKRANKNTQDSQ